MLGAWLMLAFVRRNPKSLLARRPLVTLLAVEALLCTLPAFDFMQGTPRVLLWAMLIVFTPYVWFLPYAVADQRSRETQRPAVPDGGLAAILESYLPAVRQGRCVLAQDPVENPAGPGGHAAEGDQAAALVECAARDEDRAGMAVRRSARGSQAWQRQSMHSSLTSRFRSRCRLVRRWCLATAKYSLEDCNVGRSVHRHCPPGRLPAAAWLLAAARVKNLDGVFQSLPLLLQGTARRPLLRAHFFLGISQSAAPENVFCHLHGRWGWQCAVALSSTTSSW